MPFPNLTPIDLMKLSSLFILTRRKKAILLTFSSCLMFTAVLALCKFASLSTPIPTILFFQYLVAALFLTPFVIKKRAKALPLSKIGMISLRSIAGFANYAFLFFAVQRISIVNVTLLSNSAPLFLPLLLWLWRRVKIKKRIWIGSIIGFLGIGLILKPGQEFLNIGALFGIGSALCLCISMITQRRLVKKQPIHLINFYYFLLSVLIAAPFVLGQFTPISLPTLLLLACIGILFSIGSLLFSQASRLEKPSFLSGFNYSCIVYGAFIEWVLWGQFPGWTSIVGILIICGGGLITLGKDRPQTTPEQIPADSSTDWKEEPPA